MDNEKMRSALHPSELSSFIGTENYIRHALNRSFIMTDGTHYLTKHGLAWLIDLIASMQLGNKRIREEPFQAWYLQKQADNSCNIICTDGNRDQLFNQLIEYTDYPYDKLSLYVSDTELAGKPVKVCMLTSEY